MKKGLQWALLLLIIGVLAILIWDILTTGLLPIPWPQSASAPSEASYPEEDPPKESPSENVPSSEAPSASAAVPEPLPTEDETPPTVTVGQGVVLTPGTTAAMLQPEYWQAGSALLLTPQQITAVNEANAPEILYPAAEGGQAALPLYTIPDTVDGEEVRRLIASYTLPKVGEVWYSDGQRLGTAFWQQLDAARQLDTLPSAVTVRFGFITQRTVVRSFPADTAVYNSPDRTYYDYLAQSELLPGEAIAVLHETADGDWCFVHAGSMGGWVHSTDIALCGREEWDTMRQTSDFLIVTGREVRLDDAILPSQSGGLLLPMGTRLPLMPDPPALLDGRAAYGCHVVQLPTRAADGSLVWQATPVPAAWEVSVGYLPLTAENAVRQMYRFLGQVYGWAGTLHASDCSGCIRQVYRCFGLQLPRNSAQIVAVNGLAGGSLAGLSNADKTTALAQLVPGSLLYLPGHIVLYLGMADGVPYGISAVGSFGLPGSSATVYANSTCVTPLTVTHRGGSWLSALTSYVQPLAG